MYTRDRAKTRKRARRKAERDRFISRPSTDVVAGQQSGTSSWRNLDALLVRPTESRQPKNERKIYTAAGVAAAATTMLYILQYAETPCFSPCWLLDAFPSIVPIKLRCGVPFAYQEFFFPPFYQTSALIIKEQWFRRKTFTSLTMQQSLLMNGTKQKKKGARHQVGSSIALVSPTFPFSIALRLSLLAVRAARGYTLLHHPSV